MFCIEIAQILTFYCFARYMNGAPLMNARSIGLVLSIGLVFGMAVTGFRIRLAGMMYFSPLLTASLLTPWYAGPTPGVVGGILIGFDSFNFFNFFDF